MKKALEILLMDRSDIANHKIVTTEMFNEAIAELEEAMKPKTCEGCSNFLYKDGNHYPFCLEHWFYFISKNMEKVLNCNKYDPKDDA